MMINNMPNGTDQSYFDDKRETYLVTLTASIEVEAHDKYEAIEVAEENFRFLSFDYTAQK